MATRRALESASHAMQLPTVSAKPSRRVVGPGAEITCPPLFHNFADSMSIANESRREETNDDDDERVPFRILLLADRILNDS